MGEIFKLFGSIGIKNKEANDKIDETKEKGKGLANSLGKTFKGIGKASLAIGAATASGATALMGLATKSAEATDRIDKMSQKLGLSRKGFQEWEFILSQNGASIDSMKGGMKTLNKSFDDLKTGTGVGAEAFKRLGLSYKDLKGKTQEEIFETTIKALQGVEDETTRTAIANDLLGRSGQELAPLLNAGADSVEKMKQQAHDLGLVLGDEAIDSGVKFTDTMDQLKRSMGTAFTQIGVLVMPLMQQFAEWIIANMPTIKAVLAVVFGAIQTLVKGAAVVFRDFLIPVIKTLYNWVQANMPAIKATFTQVWGAIKVIIQVVVGIIKNFLIPTIKIIYKVVTTVIPGVLRIVKSVWNGIKSITSSVWNGIKNTITRVVNGVKSIVSNVFGGVKSTISNIWNGIKNATSRTWNGIKEAIQKPIEKARELVKAAIEKIKSFFGFKVSWPKIPMPHFHISPRGWRIGDLLKGSIPKLKVDWYAKGGIFDKPTIFDTAQGFKGVGEAGPEAIMPISKLQEMIDWNSGNQEIDYDKLYSVMVSAFTKSLERINLSVNMDDRELGRVIEKKIREMQYATNTI